MSISIVRREFERGRIKGLPLEDCVAAYGCEQERKELWEARTLAKIACEEPPILHSLGRRMNNFCIGSDPEFVFTRKDSNAKLAANDLGLKPGLAAGSDQNMRLAELRGWPSTSVVEHVAGLLSSLRWMYRLYPHTRDYSWRAGAWYDNDGIGGHVHFGRKRASRPEEIRGLDGLAKVFKLLEVFNNVEWEKRIGGDNRGQRYGDYGDFRVQLHGYEYRSLPSWLCSPAKAFLCIAASKLVIFDPDITENWRNQPMTAEEALVKLKRLAQYYAGQDDDAWILKHLLARKGGLAQATLFSHDFKKAWGFDPRRDIPTTPPTSILPPCVRPDKQDCADVLNNVVGGVGLGYVEREPTFKNVLPGGYHWFYHSNPRNVARGGVGDLLSTLVFHKDYQVQLLFADNFAISPALVAGWTKAEFDLAKHLIPEFRVMPGLDTSTGIWLPRVATLVDRIRQTRAFLLNHNLLPIWTVENVTSHSYKDWVTLRAAKKAIKVVRSVPEERVL